MMTPRVRSAIASLTLTVAFLTPAVSQALSEQVRTVLRELFIQVPEHPVPAPPFSLPGPGGAPVQLADHKGRAVMIYFWTTY